MKIKKNDQILIISGKDRGRLGKVIQAFPKQEKVLIEGINMRKRHIKPKKTGEKGQIIEKPAPVHISNVKLICPKCKKPARVGYKISESETQKKGIKARICKKCQQVV